MSPEKKVPEIAWRLLARKDYSREEMRRKLKQKGFSFSEIEDVLQKLSAQQLLNDRRYGQRLADYYGREKLWGPVRIKHKLKEKGISPELADEIIAQEEKIFPAPERLKIFLKKKLRRRTLAEFSREEIKKLINQLYRQGFSWEEILDLINKEGGLAEE